MMEGPDAPHLVEALLNDTNEPGGVEVGADKVGVVDG